jgi:hypothetical protein
MDSAYSRPARPVLGRSPLRFRRFWLKGTIPTLLFLLSLGAHGLLLKLPMPPQAETPPPEPEEPALSVVTLPQPTPIARPPAPPAAATPTPDTPQPPDATPTPAEPPAPNLDLTEPQPSTAPQQVSPAPATPVSANGSAAPETPPVVEFPHPENFRAVDCGGNYDCRAVTIPEQSDNLLDWIEDFQETLRNRQYAVRSLQDEYDDPGNRVYELTAPDGSTQYALFRFNLDSGNPREALYAVVDSRAELNELYRAQWL